MNVSNSNYNGTFNDFLYLVVTVGNQVIEKGVARVVTGIADKYALPKLSSTDNPIGAYTSSAPSSETVTTTYAERSMQPAKGTMYEEFLPEDFQAVWDKWQPVGDFTNLRHNPEFIADVMTLYANKIGNQLGRNFWQGDTGSADASLNHADGIITRLAADPNAVYSESPAGVITQANVVERLSNLWQATPDKYLEDPDYAVHMNTTDYKLLQLANREAQETTVGVLATEIKDLFLNSRIIHYTGFPKNYILGAKGMANSDASNLFFGFYADAENEAPRMDYKENAGRLMFIRWDLKYDMNYREATDMVLYKPSA